MEIKNDCQAFLVPCLGAYVKDGPITPPVIATLTIFRSGKRELGCSYLNPEDNTCIAASGNDIAKRCVHLNKADLSVPIKLTMINGVEVVDATVESVGSVIARLREQRGLSLRALSDAAGISPMQLSRIERGTASPTEPKIRGLVRALKIKIQI